MKEYYTLMSERLTQTHHNETIQFLKHYIHIPIFKHT